MHACRKRESHPAPERRSPPTGQIWNVCDILLRVPKLMLSPAANGRYLSPVYALEILQKNARRLSATVDRLVAIDDALPLPRDHSLNWERHPAVPNLS